MKKLILLFALFLSFSGTVKAQDNPVSWSSSFEKINETEYNLVLKATIIPGWHLYSQFTAEGGSLPIIIKKGDEIKGYKLVGKAIESDTIKKFSDVFEVYESYFDNNAVLKQRIILNDESINEVNLNLTGQVCKEVNGVCIQIDEDFTFTFKGKASEKATVVLDERSKLLNEKLRISLKNTEILKNKNESSSDGNSSLLSIFLLGFAGGLLALLTPCVFPMIPLTVSFFTKQSKNKKKGISNAILYGLFIVIIYILLSIPFHFIDSLDPEILNNISTNVWLNIFFFVILVFFAFSFFGYYELTLPASWGNKMDSASGAGGIIGIFFMALTLAIISFSCTGPILGSLLAGSLTSDGGAMQLTAGMSGFGLALALPFALFALFPGWLNSLPKSGGWLNTTKVVLGFLELAFAFKFLSNADLVEHWGILKRELFIGIWIVIFVGLALYLFAKIKFPHDAKIKKLSFSRISFGVLVIAFVVYLIPGTMKNPTWNLNLLSGFPPPQFYSIYETETDCPLGLNCFKDFDEGLQYAKENNKPILLDFTGWACVNCRKMEENVWVENDIFTLINEDYVLISLYVDDRKKLPKDAQFNFIKKNGRLKKIETIGDKWATFQSINFKTASQPYYVLMSPDLEILHHAQQYTDRDTYHKWLKEGLEAFKKSSKNLFK